MAIRPFVIVGFSFIGGVSLTLTAHQRALGNRDNERSKKAPRVARRAGGFEWRGQGVGKRAAHGDIESLAQPACRQQWSEGWRELHRIARGLSFSAAGRP
jgi:hypothetical protein